MDSKSKTDNFVDEKSSEVNVEITSTTTTTEKETKQKPEKGKNAKIVDNNNFDNEEIEALIRRQFEKEFKFANNHADLPPMETWFSSEKWHDDDLIRMKEELNAVKSLLDNKPLKIWHAHTGRQNPAGLVISRVRRSVQPELLTQAWCKITECLNRYNLLQDFRKEKIFVSAHLCEAPGAFVTALNHHIKSQCSSISQWEWIASTLNPYYEGNTTSTMINDDRFILHTCDRWHFGPDNTGNIFAQENLDELVEKMEKHGGAHLITADGSIDCQGDPARQEEVVAPLHLAEIVAALSCLRKGGHFVLKMFTLFESESVCALYLLRTLFKDLDVFKPATSKEGNSEVYVICRGFHCELSEKEQQYLFDGISSDRVMFERSAIPDTFMDQVRECAKFFKNIQCDVIQRNIATFEVPYDAAAADSDRRKLRFLREKIGDEFLSRYAVMGLPRSERILPHIQDQAANDCRQVKKKNEEGTFSEKAAFAGDSTDIVTLRYELDHCMRPYRWSWTMSKVEWVRAPDTSLEGLDIQFGKEMAKVASSKFCTTEAIHVFEKVVQVSMSSKTSSPVICPQNAKRRRIFSGQGCLRSLADSIAQNDSLMKELANMFPEVVTNAKVLNVGPLEGNYLEAVLNSDHFYKLVQELLGCLEKLDRGSHLIVVGFPLLTRKYVGLLHVFSQNFEEIGFVRPFFGQDAIFFSDFRGPDEKMSDKLSVIKYVCLKEMLESQKVVELFPISDLTAEPHYSLVFAHNLNVLRSRAIGLLNDS